MTAPMLKAEKFYSGFNRAHDTYNAISLASDGKIYYVLSSASPDAGGQVYCYDPGKDRITFLGDLTTICGEERLLAIPQGKSHVSFYERRGKLYFATHVGFYEQVDGMDRLPENLPAGSKPYPGGHFLSYDLFTGKFEDLATAPFGEGIVSMVMDSERGGIYAITWPTGYLIHYDVEKDQLNNLGLTSLKGEAGMPGVDFRTLCRSLIVDPRDGIVYFSTAGGDIFAYNPDSVTIRKLEEVNLRLDYFGRYDPARPGSMAYNWRKIIWYAPGEAAYGVHGNSGYLFRFDPREQHLEIVERITSERSRKSGMFDQFSYGYLGFQLGPDGQTLYYLTGGPVYRNGRRVKGEESVAKGAARGIENLHLVTYNIPNHRYIDHGPVFYGDGSRPTYVNSIAIDHYGDIYMLARLMHQGRTIQDLVRIRNPFDDR